MMHWLLGGHLDFDFTDEHLLVEFSSTVGQDDRGTFLEIGEMKYRAVLVPPFVTIRQTTLQLLQKFTQAGGQVDFTGQTPRPLSTLNLLSKLLILKKTN